MLGRSRGETVLIRDLTVTLEEVSHRYAIVSVQDSCHFPRREMLLCGDRIELVPGVWMELVRIRGTRVRLGFLAPASVHIRRGELVPEERLLGPDIGGEAGGA